MTTYLAWQGSVLYKDWVKLSEVGIKDGCSVHLEEEGDEPAPPEPFEWKEEEEDQFNWQSHALADLDVKT